MLPGSFPSFHAPLSMLSVWKKISMLALVAVQISIAASSTSSPTTPSTSSPDDSTFSHCGAIWAKIDSSPSRAVWYRHAWEIRTDPLRLVGSRYLEEGHVYSSSDPDPVREITEVQSMSGWSPEIYDLESNGELPVWRIAADPHGRPIVWVAELIWTAPHESCFTKMQKSAEWAEPLKEKMDEMVLHHRLLSNEMMEHFNGMRGSMRGALMFSQGQGPTHCKSSPTYLVYAIDVSELHAHSPSEGVEQEGSEQSRDRVSRGLEYVKNLLKKPFWSADEASRILISVTTTIWSVKDVVVEQCGGRNRVSHYGIRINDVRKNAMARFGKGELSLKLHGFASAFVLQDIARVFFPTDPPEFWHHWQPSALDPMRELLALYKGFLKKEESFLTWRKHPISGTRVLVGKGREEEARNLPFRLTEAANHYFFNYEDPSFWVKAVATRIRKQEEQDRRFLVRAVVRGALEKAIESGDLGEMEK